MPTIERFNSVMDEWAMRFFRPEEFPFQNRAAYAEGAISRALSQKEDDLESYARSLSRVELDDLLFSLTINPNERVFNILIARFNKRMAKLLWVLFQYNPECYALPALISAAVPQQDMLLPGGGNLMLREGFYGNPVETVVKAMMTESDCAEAFLNRFGLIKDSPFQMHVVDHFFSVCKPNMLIANIDFLYEYISELESPEESPAVRNYLMSLGTPQYDVRLNLLLIDRLGMPSASPENWRAFPADAVARIAEWCKRYLLEDLLKKPSIKYDILTSHAKDIVEIHYSVETGVLRINYGAFAIFDPDPKSDVAFLFMNPANGMSITREELATIEELPDARDFLFNRVRSGVYRLEFFEFGKLYAEEMFTACLSEQ